MTTTPVAIALPVDWMELKIEVDQRAYAGMGKTYTPPAVAPVNAIFTISSLGGPSAGAFSILVFSEFAKNNQAVSSGDIAYNAAGSAIKTALVGTGLFASGDITASATSLPTDVTLTFGGVWAGVKPRMTLLNGSVAPGGIVGKYTTDPSGNGGYGILPAGPQEIWSQGDAGSVRLDAFLYLASVTTSGNYYVSAYR